MCSSGCITQDHASWGECVKAKGLKVQWLGGTGPSAAAQKAFEKENSNYRDAMAQGLNPKGVDAASVAAAYEEAS